MSQYKRTRFYSKFQETRKTLPKVFFGTSCRRCSQSPLCISGPLFWHELSALQSVAVRRSTGNDVSGHFFRHYFLLFFSSLFFSPPSRPFLIEGVLGSKNLFSESCLKWPITLGWTPFQTPSAILGPPGGHFGFAGGAALQAVSECPRRS